MTIKDFFFNICIMGVLNINKNNPESLSNSELLNLAEKYNPETLMGFNRASAIEELKDYIKTNNKTINQLSKSLFVNHYNYTYIDILQRDPMWVFVIWQIMKEDQEKPEENVLENYCLKVIPYDNEKPAEESFLVSVDPDARGWYLGIPAGKNRLFKIELCSVNGEEIKIIAASRIFRLSYPIRSKNEANALMKLSGIDNLPLSCSKGLGS